MPNTGEILMFLTISQYHRTAQHYRYYYFFLLLLLSTPSGGVVLESTFGVRQLPCIGVSLAFPGYSGILLLATLATLLYSYY